MPNHVHIIVVISNVGANGGSPEMSNAEIPRACQHDIDVGAICKFPCTIEYPGRLL